MAERVIGSIYAAPPLDGASESVNAIKCRLSVATVAVGDGGGNMFKSEFATNDKADKGYVDKAVYADNAGEADTAEKLAEERIVIVRGDASAVGMFDGSEDLTLNMELAEVVTAGTYCKVTVDEKGRVVGHEVLNQDDIEGLGSAAGYDVGTGAGNVLLIGEDGKIDESVLPETATVKPSKPESAAVTLYADGWTGAAVPYSQEVSVEGMTASAEVDIVFDPAEEITDAVGLCYVVCTAQADGALIFAAKNMKPGIDLTCTVEYIV